jgi:hypothetical protein
VVSGHTTRSLYPVLDRSYPASTLFLMADLGFHRQSARLPPKTSLASPLRWRRANSSFITPRLTP